MVIEKKNKLNQLLNDEELIDLSLSYSRIVDYVKNGPKALVKRRELQNQGLHFGALVNDLLFYDNDYFNEHYYKYDGEKPTATLGILCDIILKNYDTKPNEEMVLQIIQHNEFWSNIKDPIKLNNNYNKPEFWDYLNSQYEKGDRVLITSNDYLYATECVAVLRTHPYSSYFLDDNYDNHYEYRIKFEYKGFTFNGIIDLLSIDHKNKKIYITDLKTGYKNAEEFEKSFLEYRYYFQACIYTLAYDVICKDLNLEGYELMPFQFMYINSFEKLPVIWKVSSKWQEASLNGFRLGKYENKGLNQIIDDIYWYWKQNQYDIPRSIVESNGNMFIRDNFIEINE